MAARMILATGWIFLPTNFTAVVGVENQNENRNDRSLPQLSKPGFVSSPDVK